MADGLSELLDDLPGPGDVLDTLDDGRLDELLDVLDTGEAKTDRHPFTDPADR